MAILIVAMLIGMSGCINIEANQKINNDGTSEIELIYDFSALEEASSEYGAIDEDQGQDTEQMCKDFLKNTTWKNAECRITDNDSKIMISGEISLLGDPHFEIVKSIPYITYRYDVTDINNIMEDASIVEEQEEDDLEDSLVEMKSMAAMLGIEMTYTLEMPGEIVSSEMGTIRNNKAVIDMLDLMEEEDPVYVESRELNLTAIVISGIVIVAMFTALTVLYMNKKKKKHNADEDVSTEE